MFLFYSFLLDNSPGSEFYMPKFRKTLFHLHRRVQSVPKRRHIKFRRRGITHKKAYNIQNTAKVWNQELFSLLNFPGPLMIKIYLPAERKPDFELWFCSMELVIFYCFSSFNWLLCIITYGHSPWQTLALFLQFVFAFVRNI